MKILISPAKSLNFESDLPTQNFSEASFLKESRQINGVLKKLKPNDLSKLMDISDKLAELNWERNQSWKTPFTTNKIINNHLNSFFEPVVGSMSCICGPCENPSHPRPQESLKLNSPLYYSRRSLLCEATLTFRP